MQPGIRIRTFGRKSGVDTARSRVADIPLGSGSLARGLGSSRDLGLLLLLLLLFNLFRVAVEEHVDHDVPAIGRAGDGAAEAEDLTGEEPPDETDRVARLVVRGNGDIDELEGCVRVCKRDDGDVDVRRLTDGLVVHARVGDDDETRLLERAGDVVGERTGREAARDRLCTGVGGVLEHRAVAVRPGRDHTDVARVLNSGNNTSGKDDLLPSLANVEDVDACCKESDYGPHKKVWPNAPSARRFHTYGSMLLSQFLVPMCDWAARRS